MIDPFQPTTPSRPARESPVVSLLLLATMVFPCSAAFAEQIENPPGTAGRRVGLERDDQAGRLRVLIDGQEALVYQYGDDQDLAHYWPVRSPSGRSMTIEHPEPYPHHRSFWFADTVRLDGRREVSFYNALYSAASRKDPKPPFRDHVRHVAFGPGAIPTRPGQALVQCTLVWEMDYDQPVLDERRTMRIVPLGRGEYFLDVTFTVTASYGDVTFTSDAVHYAWPYVRMDPTFSVQQGGTITNSAGGVNQEGTNGKEAKWVDYTNTVEGETEGLAIFSHTDNDQPHQWLTRDYGCFGPRRVDARSGHPFALKKGQSLSRRVGILVHRGDVKTGKVAERYAQYVEGRL
jgi:hypothetical protein